MRAGDAHVSVALPGTAADDGVLAAARAEVPVPAPLGAAGTPAILSIENEAGAVPPRLIITARASDAAKLFIEGPDESWASPSPPACRRWRERAFRGPAAGRAHRYAPAREPADADACGWIEAIETQAAIPGA